MNLPLTKEELDKRRTELPWLILNDPFVGELITQARLACELAEENQAMKKREKEWREKAESHLMMAKLSKSVAKDFEKQVSKLVEALEYLAETNFCILKHSGKPLYQIGLPQRLVHTTHQGQTPLEAIQNARKKEEGK